MAQRLVAASDLTLQLLPWWTNPRTETGLSKEEIAELAAEIRPRGILVPLTVQRVTEGKTDANNTPIVHDLVLDGQRRTLAALLISKDFKVPVVDHDDKIIELDKITSTDLMLDAAAIGTFREGLSSFEQSAMAEKLRAGGATNARIGKAIRRSESWVSRMLKAREHATPELLEQWRKSTITDDQFKDLAEVPEKKQAEATQEIVELRTKKGDKSEAFARQKEFAKEAKAAKPAKPEPKAKKGKAAAPVRAAKPEPVKPVKPSAAVLEDIVTMAKKSAPVHPYVQGVVDGVKYALGLHPGKWQAAFGKWTSRMKGEKPQKKVKAPKAKAARGLKPKKKAKAPKKAAKK